MTLPQTESYYYSYSSSGYTCRAKVEEDAFNQLAAIPNINLSQYDNWKNLTASTKFSRDNSPDTYVDLCFFMIRHQTESLMGQHEIDEAMLYASKAINNITIQSGFPGYGSRGSGISFFSGNFIDQMPIQTLINKKISEIDNDGSHLTIIGCMAHELSHYLIGEGHFSVFISPFEYDLQPFGNNRSNSFIQPYGVNCSASCGNFLGYEKIRLGWITTTEILTINSTQSFTLEDMASSATGFKIAKIDLGGGQFIFVENRSWIDPYEPKLSHANFGKPLKPGLLAYLIPFEDDFLYMTDIQMICADGKWDWTRIEGSGAPGTSDRIEKLSPNSFSGYDEKEHIFIPSVSSSYKWIAIHNSNSYGSNYGRWYKGDNYMDDSHNSSDFEGDMNDFFGVGDVISKWSNGATHKRTSTSSNTFTATDIGIEITSKNSDSSYTIQVRVSQPELLAPSKPQNLQTAFDQANQVVNTWNANTEPDMAYYNIYRQLYYGSTTLSEVKINTANITGTTFTDNVVIPANIPSGVNLYVRYKIEAVDTDTKVSVKAIGNSILLGTTSSVAGTISSNTTWSGGVKLVSGNFFVNNGVTLTINSNTFVSFASGSSFQVNGYINASNTSFQGRGSSDWYGITVAGPATSYFTNCTIKDCWYGIVADASSYNSSPYVTNCNISGSVAGIWIKNYGDPQVSNSYISSSGTAAVLATNNARGAITRSKLFGTCTYGHKNDNSATTWYGYYNNARNIIQGTNFPGGNNYSIYITGGYPFFYNGNNSIPSGYGCQYYNATGSTLNAAGNYWGGGDPNVTGSVTYTPVLTSLPSPLGPDWTLSKSSGNGGEVTSDDPLALAWKAFGDNDF